MAGNLPAQCALSRKREEAEPIDMAQRTAQRSARGVALPTPSVSTA